MCQTVLLERTRMVNSSHCVFTNPSGSPELPDGSGGFGNTAGEEEPSCHLVPSCTWVPSTLGMGPNMKAPDRYPALACKPSVWEAHNEKQPTSLLLGHEQPHGGEGGLWASERLRSPPKKEAGPYLSPAATTSREVAAAVLACDHAEALGTPTASE